MLISVFDGCEAEHKPSAWLQLSLSDTRAENQGLKEVMEDVELFD